MTRAVPAPGAVPLLGHALQLRRRPLDFLAGLAGCGDLVEIRLGRRPAYLVCTPELFRRAVLESRTYDKGGPLFDKAAELVGDGLFSATWEPHRRQRRLMQPGFHTTRLCRYADVMSEEIGAQLAGWHDGRQLDVRNEMHALTLRVAARTMFTNAVSGQAVAEVQSCMPIINRGVYKRMVAPLGWVEKLPTPDNRRFARAHERISDVVDATIADYRRAGADHGDLMSILVGTGGGAFSDHEIHKQVTTLLAGGMETTANAICSALHLVSEHPDVEAQLVAELDDVLAGRAAGPDDIARLPYTRRVLWETLRIRPPVWLLTRLTTEDAELGGVHLPRGTIVLLSPYLLHHDPRMFPDPERFDPDRWRPDRAAAVPRDAMVPFIMGNRKCIGDQFALLEATLVLATIVGQWRLQAVAGARRRPLPEATLGPGPMPMQIHRRAPRPSASPSVAPAVGCPYHSQAAS